MPIRPHIFDIERACQYIYRHDETCSLKRLIIWSRCERRAQEQPVRRPAANEVWNIRYASLAQRRRALRWRRWSRETADRQIGNGRTGENGQAVYEGRDSR